MHVHATHGIDKALRQAQDKLATKYLEPVGSFYTHAVSIRRLREPRKARAANPHAAIFAA